MKNVNIVAPTTTESRIYRSSAVLADISDPYFSELDLNSKVPLRVYGDDDRLLGFGSVRMCGKELVADIAIDYATEERLLLETDTPLYLWVIGSLGFASHLRPGIGSNGSAGIDLTSRMTPRRLQVEELVISRKAPTQPGYGRLTKVAVPE